MSRRSAFTLLELLLTISLLAAIAAIALPQAGMLLGDRRLVRAGDQLRAEMTSLRVDAMREGRVMMLDGMIEGNTVRIKPFYSIADSTEAIDQTGSQQSLLTGATQGVMTTLEVDEEADETIELPEGISIMAIGVASAARSMEIEQLNQADQGQGWSRPVLFYPDGSTSTAAITLTDETYGKVVVQIRGITGDVTVSEVLAP
ncbi:prepilin-type N-terminal cleavage/methylation domain-containing protein [Rubripirellula sp.]|nr:prepilin-type N-terminal cleavage/methylation domain-containing protein [Planctomycetaceae bacterium]MDA9857775.1 prepilin-type N-terminal cleavage/methylation domain-containing protein [Rubripirellula sp.]MDF1845407.1 prepilin-type N-terminal cleavage/methylation domain-containing protein [Rubripirellula sp.]